MNFIRYKPIKDKSPPTVDSLVQKLDDRFDAGPGPYDYRVLEIIEEIVNIAPNNEWVNHQNKWGGSFAHYCVRECTVKALARLLELGMNPNLANNDGDTAIHWPEEDCDIDSVRLLVMYGADVNARNRKLETALHKAVSRKNYKICEFLVSHGADVNARNIFGETPLILAAKSEKYGEYMWMYVELFLRHGADKSIADNAGETLDSVIKTYFWQRTNKTIMERTLFVNSVEKALKDKKDVKVVPI